MSHPPSHIPPEHLTEAYLNEYNGAPLVGVAIAFSALEVLFVALRLIARRVGRISFAADDALVLAGLVLCLGINSMALVMVQYAHVGHHVETVMMKDPGIIVLWAKFFIAESFLYLVSVTPPKLAILLIYIRVFPLRPIRIICYILGAIMIVNSIVLLFFAGFDCQPMAYLWDKTIPGGFCMDIHTLYMWASFPNIVTDVVMLGLPIPMIWNLQVPNHVKLGLTFTFLTGSIGLAASILRFHSFATINPLIDPTWASVILLIWTIVEAGAYLIAACLPTLRPLVLKFWNGSRFSAYSRSGHTGVAASKRASSAMPLKSPTPATMKINKTVSVSVHGRRFEEEDYFELITPGESLEKLRPGV